MTTQHSTRADGALETSTMTAITQHRYGGPEVLGLDTLPVPTPGPAEVLVKVHAGGLDRGTWHLMAGEPFVVRMMFGLGRPTQPVLGIDVAGVVVAVGDDVTRFAAGDEVFGIARGSFAEYAVATEAKLAKKPAAVSFEQAAVTPVSGLTALQAVHDRGGVAPGQRVLVIGASGGVGTFAVQIAVALGATVTAVCSTRNVELVRSLGAHDVIDYTERDVTDGDERFDVIFDVVGNHPLSKLRRILTPKGILVLSSGSGGPVLGPIGRLIAAAFQNTFVSQQLRPVTASANAADLVELTALIDAGKVRPSIERSYPLAETAEALRHFGEQHARGKIGISVL